MTSKLDFFHQGLIKEIIGCCHDASGAAEANWSVLLAAGEEEVLGWRRGVAGTDGEKTAIIG